MNRIKAATVVLLLAVCTVFLGSARETLAARDYGGAGRLLIKHSPVLGFNVGVVVRIDGREAGAFTKGHVYQAYLSPGPHLIEIFRNGRLYDSGHMILHVRPGHTNAYVAKYTVNELYLKRVTGFR